MPIPLFDAATPVRAIEARVRAALDAVLADGAYVLGPHVEGFERAFAQYVGAGHAIGVANGTEAITIALRALGVGPGDDVVVPSFTFYASAEAIPPTGARPVFCDVDPETFVVTPEAVRAALTPATKAVVAVHLFGNVAPVGEIEALGVPVVEDAAQAAGSRAAGGARTGALGTLATFSFYPSKNLGAFGDGGAITTSDAALAETARTLRFHGSRDGSTYELVGYNSRLDALQAAILHAQLPELDRWCEGRRVAGRRYAQRLEGVVGLPRPTAGSDPAWGLYVVRDREPDALADALAAERIGARGYYRTPVHRQPALAGLAPPAELPGTEEAARTHLAIPMGAALGDEEVDAVAAAIRAARR